MSSDIRILVVDDDKNAANAISEVVKRLGYKPIVVTKVYDALNVARVQTVHGAIIDVLLPKIGGVDLALEFRKTKFGANPIVLISGVFKDKNFSTDAIKKTDAVNFLFKPFGAEDLWAVLKESFADVQASNFGQVQSLLTRQLTTSRQCSKAIEGLEQLTGSDLPFILGIVMAGKLSGDLNIFNETGDIFGVKLNAGMISGVDSSESMSNGVLSLIASGFLTKEDWEVLQGSGKRRFSLDYLVQEGLVSPHAVGLARHEQILYDLKSMVSAQSLKINFVRGEDNASASRHAVSMMELFHMLSQSADDFFHQAYLQQFYEKVLNAPIQVVWTPAEMQSVWSMRRFNDLEGFREILARSGTLSEALAVYPDKEREIYLCLHYLVLCRAVLFADESKAKNLSLFMERLTVLRDQLTGKSPDKVFEYLFGREVSSATVVEKIYTDYLKSNGPDQLPKDASPDLVAISNECLKLVQAARDVMVDDQKRLAMLQAQKHEEIEKVNHAKELTIKGLELLRKGQFSKAVETLKQAESFGPSNYQFMIQTWAEIKAGLISAKQDLINTQKKMEMLSTEDRKSSHYNMVMGLIKKSLGDVSSATSYFEKAVQADGSFMEARRELTALSTVRETKDKKLDLLTSDIGDIVSTIFRRKAE